MSWSSGCVLLKSAGSIEAVLASDAVMLEHRNDWLVRETIGLLRRTLARLDVSSRSMYAVIEPGSCFAGMLLELAWPPTAATCWRCRKKSESAEDRAGWIQLRHVAGGEWTRADWKRGSVEMHAQAAANWRAARPGRWGRNRRWSSG